MQNYKKILTNILFLRIFLLFVLLSQKKTIILQRKHRKNSKDETYEIYFNHSVGCV